jgi:hypothetical protein
MSSGLLALACVISLQRATTSTEANGGDEADAQPARCPNNRSGIRRVMDPVLAEARGSIVCSFRLDPPPRTLLFTETLEVRGSPTDETRSPAGIR